MISMEQITGEIAALEEEKPTHVTMQKLAALYTVRDHMTIDSKPIGATVSAEAVPSVSESDFAKLIDGKPLYSVFPVIDELMDTLQIIQPRLYDGVMRKLAE